MFLAITQLGANSFNFGKTSDVFSFTEFAFVSFVLV